MSQERKENLEPAQPVPEEISGKGSEKISNKERILWALGMGWASALVLFGVGESFIILRNIEWLGMTPISESGTQSYRVFNGVLSLVGTGYGWAVSSRIKA